ncbi:MAG: flagellar M-ring protein FliF [Fimbriimonadaceae bacterium]|nr:flagellar M-ring protein FliF [Fimbriimonadaceae bacterium]
MTAIINKIKGWWITADRTQKLVTLFGSGFLLVLLAMSIFFARRPNMQPIFSGLTPADQGMIVQELTQAGIPVEFSARGDVTVPADRVAEARMKLAQSNKMPASGPKGNEWLEGITSLTTPLVEKEKMKEALEGELARSINTMTGVASSIVHLTVGTDSRVASLATPSSAAVIVTQSSSGEIDEEAGRAMARLVQNSVPNLKEENISVTDNTGAFLFDGREVGRGSSGANQKLTAEINESKRREIELQRLLDVPFGPGNTIARVSVELEMDDVTESTLINKVDEGVVTESMTEKLSGAAASAGGVSGIESNISGATNTGGSNSGNYESKTTRTEVPTTQTNRTTKFAPGEVSGMAVTVLVNKEKIKDVEAVRQAVAGFAKLDYDAAQGGIVNSADVKATVTETEFDTTAADAQTKAAAAAGGSARIQQIVSFLPIAALLAVGFMLTKAIGKSAPRAIASTMPAEGLLTMGVAREAQIRSEHNAALALEHGGGASNAPNPKILELVKSGQSGSAISAADRELLKQQATPEQAEMIDNAKNLEEVMAALGIDPEGDIGDIEGIARKLDLPLEQIKKMARQRPETVAMLLKSWLVEDK